MPGFAAQPDLLERLFQRLVANIAALDPAALHRPVAVGDLADRLVPYRTHRAALGVDTNEDYEMTVLRLLSGERGYAQVFPEDIAVALTKEARSVNPDTGLFRQFPDATFLLDADRVADLTASGGRRTPDPHGHDEEPPVSALAPPMHPAPREEPAVELQHDDNDEDLTPLPFVLEEDPEGAPPLSSAREISPASAPCPYCGGSLPVGRTVLFCPHCGQNIGVVHCPTCGSELDVGWEFCITCGQKVTGLG